MRTEFPFNNWGSFKKAEKYCRLAYGYVWIRSSFTDKALLVCSNNLVQFSFVQDFLLLYETMDVYKISFLHILFSEYITNGVTGPLSVKISLSMQVKKNDKHMFSIGYYF